MENTVKKHNVNKTKTARPTNLYLLQWRLINNAWETIIELSIFAIQWLQWRLLYALCIVTWQWNVNSSLLKSMRPVQIMHERMMQIGHSHWLHSWTCSIASVSCYVYFDRYKDHFMLNVPLVNYITECIMVYAQFSLKGLSH